MTITYEVVNPKIEGSISLEYKGSTPIDAAKNAYDALSEEFATNVPVFMFSLRKVNTNELHHFRVTEKVNATGSGSVNYNIVKITNLSPEGNNEINDFANESFAQLDMDKNGRINPEMSGGGSRYSRYDDSSSSSSLSDSSISSSLSDSDDHWYYHRPRKNQHKIEKVSYFPYAYASSSKVLYIPTFKTKSQPYVFISVNKTP